MMPRALYLIGLAGVGKNHVGDLRLRFGGVFRELAAYYGHAYRRTE